MSKYETILLLFAVVNIFTCSYIWIGGKKQILKWVYEIKSDIKEIGFLKYIFKKLKSFVVSVSIINILPTILAIGIFIDGARYGRNLDVKLSLSYIVFECILLVVAMIVLGDIKIKLGQSKKEIA